MIDIYNNFYKGKRVLVTGHTGFKGSWLSIWLNELGAEVVGVALEPHSEKDNFVLSGIGSKIKADIRADIRDSQKMKDIFLEYQPEIVFHLAAQPLVRLSYDIPVETYEVNVMGTINIMEAIRITPSVKVGVMITTDKCYDNKEQLTGYKEDDPFGGYDPYSQYNPQPYATPEYSQPFNYGAMPNTYSQPVQNPGYVGADMQGYQGYNQPNYGVNNYQGYNQQQTVYGGDSYQDYAADVEDVEEEIEDIDETPVKKKIVRTKENEPRPRNLKTKEKPSVKEESMEKRGRPKKQEVSESMVIKSDKEFDEVLARAEKLMRKSEEGLSESQSKRIEKELKMLMDAMNRYKETK